jgi:hypothetical protein
MVDGSLPSPPVSVAPLPGQSLDASKLEVRGNEGLATSADMTSRRRYNSYERSLPTRKRRTHEQYTMWVHA